MEKVKKLLNEIMEKKEIIYGVLSNPRKNNKEAFNKVDIKPVLIKDEIKVQLAFFYKSKVIHENLDLIESVDKIDRLLIENFSQAMIFTKKADYQILISKKAKVNILKKKASKKEVNLEHNRIKDYIIQDGEPCDFLMRLGVMNEKGKVVARRYDKFRQINRFLEMVSDVIPTIENEEVLNIIDFGCGKSYLTFALYYYLVDILGLDVNIIGLDLKHDVIKFCNKLATELNYDKLKFIHGDIKDFEGSIDVDMVVTLHACDTATDAALVKAVNWDAKLILSVPCCQHEFYDKIQNPILQPMLKHGIIREKLSSLVTDSLRSNVLEILGYEVQLLEFIDMDHTPKNILIRAIKTNNINNKEAIDSYIKFKEFWGLEDLYIEKEFGEKLREII